MIKLVMRWVIGKRQCIEELADTKFSEKKSSTKDVKKGTDELAYTLLSENKLSTKDV